MAARPSIMMKYKPFKMLDTSVVLKHVGEFMSLACMRTLILFTGYQFTKLIGKGSFIKKDSNSKP